jgi:hypothetical protein
VFLHRLLHWFGCRLGFRFRLGLELAFRLGLRFRLGLELAFRLGLRFRFRLGFGLGCRFRLGCRFDPGSGFGDRRVGPGDGGMGLCLERRLRLGRSSTGFAGLGDRGSAVSDLGCFVPAAPEEAPTRPSVAVFVRH